MYSRMTASFDISGGNDLGQVVDALAYALHAIAKTDPRFSGAYAVLVDVPATVDLTIVVDADGLAEAERVAERAFFDAIVNAGVIPYFDPDAIVPPSPRASAALLATNLEPVFDG